MKILFVTYDGPQVSYLESLFLPIFSGLRERGFEFDVLQFRWGDQASESRAFEACRAAGVGYEPVAVWRRGGGAGPFLSMLVGGRKIRKAVHRFGSHIVMPRSLMPALALLAGGGRKLRPIVFDADGLLADEMVEVAGLSPTGATYRILRDVEAQIVRHATSVITRSQIASEILRHRAGPPVALESFHVVANGRDDERFRPLDLEERASVRAELGIDIAAPLLVYAGSLGPQYRPDAMKAVFQEVRRLRPHATMLVLTGSPDRAVEAFGEEGRSVIIRRVPPHEVGRYLGAADVGLAYRSTSFSMQGVAPVKLSEYLLCGLPVIGTAEIGDTSDLVEHGIFFDDLNGSVAAARWLIDEVLPARDSYLQRARAAGLAKFSLVRSIEDYARALEPFAGAA